MAVQMQIRFNFKLKEKGLLDLKREVCGNQNTPNQEVLTMTICPDGCRECLRGVMSNLLIYEYYTTNHKRLCLSAKGTAGLIAATNSHRGSSLIAAGLVL